jgi:hypothetical protein
VNKTNLALTSLVAAIPGAWLAVLMVMAFVSFAGGWSVTVKGLAGALLLIGGVLAVMPIGILVLGGPKTEKPAKPKEKAAKAAADDDELQAAAVVDDDAFVSDDATFEVDQDARDSEEFVETIGQPAVEADSDDFDLGADFELDSVEDVEPKKKKGK